jgi:hypothetical protein
MNLNQTIRRHRVIEFKNIGDLNDWLEGLAGSYDVEKIFRSSDKVYFVWYSYEEKPIPK